MGLGNHSKQSRGFTLLEVVIALAILGVTFGALLSIQASSMNKAGKARDLTIATLLARSKMIDIEQTLFDEGFTEGEDEESGDFEDEGRGDIKWTYTVKEVELDLGTLNSLCGGFEDSDSGAGAGCEDMLGGFGVLLESFSNTVSHSVRVVDLQVIWPVAKNSKFTDSIAIRALVTKEDYNLVTQSALQQLTGASGGSGAGGAGPGPGDSVNPDGSVKRYGE